MCNISKSRERRTERESDSVCDVSSDSIKVNVAVHLHWRLFVRKLNATPPQDFLINIV